MFLTKAFYDSLLSERDWLRAEVQRLGAEITRLTTAPVPVDGVLTPQTPSEPLPEAVSVAMEQAVRPGTAEYARLARWAREQIRLKRPADEIARAIREGEEE